MLADKRKNLLHIFFGIGILVFVLVLIFVLMYFKSRADDITASVTIQNQKPTAATFYIMKESDLPSSGTYSPSLSDDLDTPSAGEFAPTAGDTSGTKIYLNGFVTDPDGAADIDRVFGIARLNSDDGCPHMGGGGPAPTDVDTCLIKMPCTLGGAVYSGDITADTSNDRSFSCAITVPFYAQPGTWQVAIGAWDTSEASDDCPPFYDQETGPDTCPDSVVLWTESSPTFTMADEAAVSPMSDTFSFGTLAVSTSTTNANTDSGRYMTFQQQGNVPADVQISGADYSGYTGMVCRTAGTDNTKRIPMANQQFAKTSGLDYNSGTDGDGDTSMKALTSSPVTVPIDVDITTFSATDPFDGSVYDGGLSLWIKHPMGNVYWNILTPSDVKGVCTGTIVASGIAHT